MPGYQPIQNYLPYQQPIMPPAYPDRLAQLQNQYQQIVNQPQPQQVNQGLLWVQGDAGAKSYLVAPNTTVLLMDSEAQRFYLKSTDGSGIPNLRTFEYTEVSPNVPQAPNSNDLKVDDKYVTREEYEGLKRKYDDIMERLENISTTAESESSAKFSKSKGRGGNVSEQSDT